MKSKQQILKDRAALQAVPMKESIRDIACEIMVFRVGHEHYGVESDFVREACVVNHLAQIPCTPEWLAGVINRRGRIVSVLDLGRLFGIPHSAEKNKMAIVLGANDFECGINAAEIVGRRTVYKDEIQEAGHRPAQEMPPKWFKDLTYDGVVILDCRKIFSDESIVINDAAAMEQL
jgi:purine-binding chemotaxis protein CheW